jgi:hypothetical protein
MYNVYNALVYELVEQYIFNLEFVSLVEVAFKPQTPSNKQKIDAKKVFFLNTRKYREN